MGMGMGGMGMGGMGMGMGGMGMGGMGMEGMGGGSMAAQGVMAAMMAIPVIQQMGGRREVNGKIGRQIARLGNITGRGVVGRRVGRYLQRYHRPKQYPAQDNYDYYNDYGSPGMGQPGMMGYRGVGHPGMAEHPGMGYPGMGHPGMGHPGMVEHPGMGQTGYRHIINHAPAAHYPVAHATHPTYPIHHGK